MKYKLLKSGVLDTENGKYIPNDNDNFDWRKYQAWLAEGNTPDPADTDPAPPKTYTAYEFINRFTDAERTLIISSADINVRLFLGFLYAAQDVVVTNTRTAEGMAYLVSAGLLTEARKTEILG
jgi:hypothetical protein